MNRNAKQKGLRWMAVVLATGALFLGAVPHLRANKNETGVNPPVQLKTDTQPVPRDVRSGTSYAPVVDRVAPSVVQVFTTARPRFARTAPGMEDPIFRWFFGEPGPGQGFGPGRGRTPNVPDMPRQSGMGSGVLVTPDGYILTNNHVVEGADEVKVALNDGREFDARVIGKDPKTDVAVLKVDGSDLPHATVADSDLIAVGDVVMAIGNPFGVGQTVTLGIISAKGRGVGIINEGYEDFIQTDASINPGNSGGALVDVEGRLIGINTAIVSRSGGNQGIGFAIPSNLVREVMESLVLDGRVTRGFLGVSIQNLNPALARKLKLESANGALVAEVNSGSPAARSGVKSGDVIIAFNEKDVKDSRQLRLEVARTRPGETVPMQVMRDGRPRTLKVTVRELEDGAQSALGETNGPADEGVLVGVGVADLDGRARQQWNIPSNVQGALVFEVEPGSEAAEAGLRPGDVILEINRELIQSAEQAVDITRETDDRTTLLKVWSQGNTRFIVVDESGN